MTAGRFICRFFIKNIAKPYRKLHFRKQIRTGIIKFCDVPLPVLHF